MTATEAYNLIRQLRTVFPVVRLVDVENATIWNINEDRILFPEDCCYAYWGKSGRCENCTSARATGQHPAADKYEFRNSEAYHVASRYLEIDGKGLVLEIISRFEDKEKILVLADEEKERRHVMDTLARDFEWVDYISLKAKDGENSLSAYRISENLSKTIPGWTEEHSFQKRRLLAADFAVVPEDRELFLSETALSVVRSHLEKEDIYYVSFRMGVSGLTGDYQMKFHADRDEGGNLVGFAAGCHKITTETKNSLSYKKSAIESVKNVIPAAFWYEELDENGRMKAIYYSDEIRSMLGYSKEEFPDELDALVSRVHPDDRQIMLDAVIAAGTGKLGSYNVEYRILRSDGAYLWINATGQLIKNDDGVTEGMYGAFIDISDHKLKERDMEIINLLASEYTGVYFVDLMTGEATPYSMNDDAESRIGGAFQNRIRFSDVYRIAVDNLVCDEDRTMMWEAGTVGNIMKELRSKKIYTVTYRDNNRKFCEMKFIKMGDPLGAPEAVAVCFSEKDEEFRAKEEATQRLKRNLDIIGILASEYTSVYYIDLTTDELDTYTMNEETESRFGQVFRAGIKYSSAFKMYVNTFVAPEDKEKMRKAGSVFNILDELADKKTFLTSYRDADGKNCEMKFVKVGEEEYPRAVALGFSDKK